MLFRVIRIIGIRNHTTLLLSKQSHLGTVHSTNEVFGMNKQLSNLSYLACKQHFRSTVFLLNNHLFPNNILKMSTHLYSSDVDQPCHVPTVNIYFVPLSAMTLIYIYILVDPGQLRPRYHNVCSALATNHCLSVYGAFW